jgi:hypothetical protein
MARVVNLLVPGRDAVAAEMLPPRAMGEEDPDRGPAFAAHRDGLLILWGRGALRCPGISPSREMAAVNAISNASGSITLKNASADAISSTVAFARRFWRCRAAASGCGSGCAFRPGKEMMVDMLPLQWCWWCG